MTATHLVLADEAVRILRVDEGARRHAYDDATGANVHAPVGRLSIGIGTNLRVGLDPEEMDWLCRHRLHKETARLADMLTDEPPPVFLDQLPDKARIGLMLMAYQLGADDVVEFHRMLAAVRKGDWSGAAEEALASDWNRETPKRAKRVAGLLREAGE